MNTFSAYDVLLAIEIYLHAARLQKGNLRLDIRIFIGYSGKVSDVFLAVVT